ncbi:MAG TPA: biotin/lipoate A/B protein ligase family protein [Ktedonobacteraceae bacterium]|nr:biotin/lipoate A/B protein ligase family protein [Ktedonobacteraceae bacterium]
MQDSQDRRDTVHSAQHDAQDRRGAILLTHIANDASASSSRSGDEKGSIHSAQQQDAENSQSRQYRFLNTGTQNAALNMAIDEAVLIHHLRGEAPPTLRVFRWSQPSISLGRFQYVEREILVDACQRQGIALVRRPTGGRAVYHRDEFTYSMVIGKSYNVPSGVVAAYAYLAQGIIAALGKLGVQAELSEGRVSKTPAAACFASSTQADLTSGGYKMVGSAQVWRDDALLQQGSLPLDDRSAEFYALLAFPSEAERSSALALYREHTTPLHTFAPNVSWYDVASAFSVGFSEALHTEFVPGELSTSEWNLARQLVQEKYNHLTWREEKVRLV